MTALSERQDAPSGGSAARGFWRRVGHYLPGVATVGFTIGTGSVTAMAKAGADYGMQLLWALALSCWLSFVLLSAVGRLAMVTRVGPLHAIRDRIHPALAGLILAAVSFNVGVSILGVMGIVADVLAVWARESLGLPWPAIFWATAVSAFLLAILLRGSVRRVERVLAALAAIMSLCFLLNVVMTPPPLADVLRGMAPTLPELADKGLGSLLVVASIVGTTVAPVVILFRGLMVRSEGWAADHAARQRRDAACGAALIFLVCAAVMAAAAATLHQEGVVLRHTSEMIGLLRPSIGATGVWVFVLGVTAAGVSSQAPNIASLPTMARDFQRRDARFDQAFERCLIVGAVVLGLLAPLVAGPPVAVMLFSQALNALVLPLVAGSLWRLLARPRPGEPAPSRWVLGELAIAFAMTLLISGATFLSLVTR